MDNNTLIKFWKVIYLDYLKASYAEGRCRGRESEEAEAQARRVALEDIVYEPIDTYHCVIFSKWLRETSVLYASNGLVVNVIEGGRIE